QASNIGAYNIGRQAARAAKGFIVGQYIYLVEDRYTLPEKTMSPLSNAYRSHAQPITIHNFIYPETASRHVPVDLESGRVLAAKRPAIIAFALENLTLLATFGDISRPFATAGALNVETYTGASKF
uniref:Uncharacterized protein n=1 Tax=Romanomermis culicivorax TaxID=13658 RepID=A0A915HTW0_ROMCU